MVAMKIARVIRPAYWRAEQHATCDAMEAAGDRLLNAATEAEQGAAKTDYDATSAAYGAALRALHKPA